MLSRPIILTLVPCYLPGYKAGGPIRTIANMVDRLHDSFMFRIVTADRDHGDKHHYEDLEFNQWVPVGNGEVFYASRHTQTPWGLTQLIRRTPHDVLYLNSLFSPRFTLLPLGLRRLNLVPRRPVILAPRGELGFGALALKPVKKRVFLVVAKWAGLYNDVVWHASSAHEAQRIFEVMGVSRHRIVLAVHVAPDLPAGIKCANDRTLAVREHPLTVMFLSRIAPMKNLDFALRVLLHVQARVDFLIYGIVEDAGYWDECQQLMASVPNNVRIEYRGEVPHEQVHDVLCSGELFFLPTRGENYGHVIIEALWAGLPVLISDQTPWNDVQNRGVGWALPLTDVARFAEVIDACASATPEARFRQSQRALLYAADVMSADDAIDANTRMFRGVLHEAESAEVGE